MVQQHWCSWCACIIGGSQGEHSNNFTVLIKDLIGNGTCAPALAEALNFETRRIYIVINLSPMKVVLFCRMLQEYISSKYRDFKSDLCFARFCPCLVGSEDHLFLRHQPSNS